jgi:hypothetical protein
MGGKEGAGGGSSSSSSGGGGGGGGANPKQRPQGQGDAAQRRPVSLKSPGGTSAFELHVMAGEWGVSQSNWIERWVGRWVGRSDWMGGAGRSSCGGGW